MSISAAADSPRNMSLLMLASPLSFMLPAIHGTLADHLGFQASFALALFAAITALLLLYKLPSRRALLTVGRNFASGVAAVSRPPCIEPKARRRGPSAWRPKPRLRMKFQIS